MGIRLPYTPNSKIKAALRQLWLRSRERAAALKRTGYTCEICGLKQSKAKGREVSLEVHHRHGILNWDELINHVRSYLLPDPKHLQPLCKECHANQHKAKEIESEARPRQLS